MTDYTVSSSSPRVEYPPTPSPMRLEENPVPTQPETERVPDEYLSQMQHDILMMQGQMDNLMFRLREQDADNSRLREELRKKDEELRLSQSQANSNHAGAHQNKTSVKRGKSLTLEDFLALDEQRNAKLVTSMIAQQRKKPVIRLADVKALTLEDLSALTSRTNLNQLFRDIEATTDDDGLRITSALMKIDSRIADGLRKKTEDGGLTWSQFQDMCHSKYDNKVDTLTIIRELNKFPYDIYEEPRLYKNRVEAHLQSMPASDESLDLPELIKKSMYKGLPKDLGDQVECAVTNKGVDANDFVTMLELVRCPYIQIAKSTKVRELTQANYQLVEAAAPKLPQTGNPGNTYEEVSASMLSDIGKGQQALVRAVESLNKNLTDGQRRVKKPWCGYCPVNANHHWVRDCPKKPPYGSCFSCLGMGHRKGDPACPTQQA